MKIASKLFVIVILTVFEISITLWAVFEITKGATFHQLNSLHLKYSAELSEQVFDIERGGVINIQELQTTIRNVNKQAEDCLQLVNFIDEFIMKQIGTYHALELCEKDINYGNNLRTDLKRFENGDLSKSELIVALKNASATFKLHSNLFEEPIAQTVSFVFRTMIPLVVFISLFNILFITLVSRNITGSIRSVIRLLSEQRTREDLHSQINMRVTGELKTLLDVAKERIENDILNSENNEKLENLIQKRTALLTKANEELAQFAYKASHDLTSPLTSSKGLVGFIKEDMLNGNVEEAQLNLDRIYVLLEKQEKLIRNVLTLTKAQSTLDAQEIIDFNEILADIRVRLQASLDENNIKLSTHIALNSSFQSTLARVTLILENLISNSIKYYDPTKNSAIVTVDVKQENETIVMKVVDNGLGIPEDKHDDVYKMFTRFHPKISTGTGLGMSIVKREVEALQGSIDFTSTANGTEFVVRLPQHRKEADV